MTEKYPCSEHNLDGEDFEIRAAQIQECVECEISPERCTCKKILMGSSTVKIRKEMYDSVVNAVKNNSLFYDSIQEFVESGIRNELIKIKKVR